MMMISSTIKRPEFRRRVLLILDHRFRDVDKIHILDFDRGGIVDCHPQLIKRDETRRTWLRVGNGREGSVTNRSHLPSIHPESLFADEYDVMRRNLSRQH
jgi:hypothetical protein